MNKTQNILVGIFMVLLVGVSAWIFFHPIGTQPQPAVQKLWIYFAKTKGSEPALEAVDRPFQSNVTLSNKDKITLTLTALFDGPTAQEQAEGYFTEIPKGTKLVDVKDDKKGLTVSLSPQFTSGGGSNSMTQRIGQVVKTIENTKPSKPVWLSVSGKTLTTLGGEGLNVTEPINP